ncbi:MAG: CDP-alcohol phosphatidyltransferase family protein [Pseudomonadota bacterium]
MTLANRLTLIRAALVLPYAFFVLQGQLIVAAALFAIAAATDLLDGYVARQRKEETAMGRVLDPIADKMLTIAALIVLVANGTLTGLLLAPVLIIALRELWISGLREGMIDTGAELPVSPMAKVKTALQLLALFLLTFGPSTAGHVLFWLSALVTLITGLHYTIVSMKILNLGAEGPANST